MIQKGGTEMFDVMKYAADHHVEVDVRPGTRPVVWEFFIRDRGLDLVKFTQIFDYELERQHNVDLYMEKRCDALMEDVTLVRQAQKTISA
jgi:hypothetical protein